MPIQPGLVSVIIPCYNAERWLPEAIDSCLAQTYGQIEIIVIDDGSVDRSLDIIKSYGEQVIFETGPNRGPTVSRNRGFALSSGEFIQYLDADDYLLPTKIEQQVLYLLSTGADTVYGDWRHQHHRPGRETSMDKVDCPGSPNDVLVALLGGEWWVPLMALLHRRHVVERVGGWDESLQEMDDFDFMLSAVLHGCDLQYLAGLGSVYRVYGHTSLSRANPKRLYDSTRIILEKAERTLMGQQRFKQEYRDAMALRYFKLARRYYELDRREHASLLKKTYELSPNFRPRETALYRLVHRSFGVAVAERLAHMKRRIVKRLPGQSMLMA